MSGENINQIVDEKLDKNNFHAWKFRMTNFLMGKGYWEYIEGEHEEAPVIPKEKHYCWADESFQRLELGSQESIALAVH